MRRILLTLVGLGMFFCGTSTAEAHGYGHHGYRGYARPAYYRGYVGGYGAGYCGAPLVGNYGYGYGPGVVNYGYPQAGFGVAGRNFSLWFNQ